eukprot:TRINITY_DN9543_c0_g4_i1.p1 TRINITY_DN9543_c0_g4~~TRINITY_DN9543_c0_g4_i1.p1  ORF type:complete len:904 (-),score=125.31 TRINITY_DN9543_c0_g4_i1:128-2839(-)
MAHVFVFLAFAATLTSVEAQFSARKRHVQPMLAQPSYTSLDCGARRLALEYALRAQPWLSEASRKAVSDALELPKCSATWAAPDASTGESSGEATNVGTRAAKLEVVSWSEDETAAHVSVEGSDDSGDGSSAAPFQSLHRALEYLRDVKHVGRGATYNRTVVLHAGVHYLGSKGTLHIEARDSGIRFVAEKPGAEVWLSGGFPIERETTTWEKVSHPSTGGKPIWKTTLPVDGSHTAPGTAIRSLFTLETHERLMWARYPNMDVEIDMWGYSSPGHLDVSIPSNHVVEWIKPAAGEPPSFIVVDLTQQSNPTGVVKNNSQMTGYNLFNIGQGGVCSTVWEGSSYWCGNTSAGGWAEVDFQSAIAGRLQIPVGMRWNASLARLSGWSDPRGAFLHAWHSQTWAMHMFEIESFDAGARNMSFTAGSGSQGGRNWCRCDECGYAAGFWSDDGNYCGRMPDSSGKDTRLLGGSFIIEGVFEELDRPGEFWYNVSSRELWVWPNTTDAATSPPPTLVVPVLTSIVSVDGATDVTFDGISFRDAVSTYDKRWSAPSGGDWALHRSASLFVRDAHGVSIQNCTFRRLDGNAVMLAGRVRNTSISRCSFEWIGQNAAAAWGDTDSERPWDGRTGTQPRGTVIQDSVFHDVGLFQKQSSAWFQAKSAQTTIRNNIMYNLPRAAINFNDGFGGGSIVEDNLIFNSCRESGDHGPINSWDRQPFLTDVAGGPLTSSFDPAPNTIASNFIWANYGAGQGVDNDDGSSFYRIHNNVFYDADGFKMDYGGHGSAFTDNLVITKTGRGECIGVGPFLRNLGDAYVNNTCWVMASSNVVGSVAQCDPDYIDFQNNRFGTLHGDSELDCGGTKVSLIDLYRTKRIGQGSVIGTLPPWTDILHEMRRRLDLPERLEVPMFV